MRCNFSVLLTHPQRAGCPRHAELFGPTKRRCPPPNQRPPRGSSLIHHSPSMDLLGTTGRSPSTTELTPLFHDSSDAPVSCLLKSVYKNVAINRVSCRVAGKRRIALAWNRWSFLDVSHTATNPLSQSSTVPRMQTTSLPSPSSDSQLLNMYISTRKTARSALTVRYWVRVFFCLLSLVRGAPARDRARRRHGSPVRGPCTVWGCVGHLHGPTVPSSPNTVDGARQRSNDHQLSPRCPRQ